MTKIEKANHEVAELADELIYGGGLRSVPEHLVVVEMPDNSDPHYRLCDALTRRRALMKATK